MASINRILRDRFPETTSDDLEPVSIAGFSMLVRTTESVKKTATTTTSYVEDGSFLSDHIVDNPRVITITGNVSDIHIKGDPTSKVLDSAQTALSGVSQFIPERTLTQVSKISGLANDILDAEDFILKSAQRNPKILNSLGLSDIANQQLVDLGIGENQKKFINTIEDTIQGQRTSDAVFQDLTVGPNTYKNMVITDFEFNLDNKEKSLNFTIQFTEVRIAKNNKFKEAQDKDTPVKNTSQKDGESVQGIEDKGTIAPPVESTLTERIAAIETEQGFFGVAGDVVNEGIYSIFGAKF